MLFDVFLSFRRRRPSKRRRRPSKRRQSSKSQNVAAPLPPLSFSKVSYSAVPTYISHPALSIDLKQVNVYYLLFDNFIQ